MVFLEITVVTQTFVGCTVLLWEQANLFTSQYLLETDAGSYLVTYPFVAYFRSDRRTLSITVGLFRYRENRGEFSAVSYNIHISSFVLNVSSVTMSYSNPEHNRATFVPKFRPLEMIQVCFSSLSAEAVQRIYLVHKWVNANGMTKNIDFLSVKYNINRYTKIWIYETTQFSWLRSRE